MLTRLVRRPPGEGEGRPSAVSSGSRADTYSGIENELAGHHNTNQESFAPRLLVTPYRGTPGRPYGLFTSPGLPRPRERRSWRCKNERRRMGGATSSRDHQ